MINRQSPYVGSDVRLIFLLLVLVEETILDAIECLKSGKLPAAGPDCDDCKYRRAVRDEVSRLEG